MHNSTNKLSGRWSTLLKRHSNAPTAAIALCFSTGIAFSLICHEYLFSCFAVAGIALIFASATVLHKGRLGLSLVLGLAAILLSGLLMALAHRDGFSNADVRSLLNRGSFPLNEPVYFDGCIVSDSEARKDESVTTVQLKAFSRKNHRIECDGTAILRISRPDRSEAAELTDNLLRGDGIKGWAAWRIPRNFRNPGSIDRAGSLARRGIFIIGRVKSHRLLEIFPGACSNPWTKLATTISSGVRRSLEPIRKMDNGQPAAVLASLTIGDYSGLSTNTREVFQNCGTFHVLVISGLHVAWITGLLLLCLKLIRVPERIRYLLAAGAILLYTCVVGFQASITRCLWIFMLYLIGRTIFRRVDSINILFSAALILLVAEPDWVFETGFQLSFLSVMAIVMTAVPVIDIYLKPVFDPLRNSGNSNRLFFQSGSLHRFGRNLRARCEMIIEALSDRLPPFIARIFYFVCRSAARTGLTVGSVVIASLSVQLWLGPLLALNFNRISWIAPLANLSIVPFSSIVLAAGMFASLSSNLPFVGPVLIQFAGKLASVLLSHAASIAAIPGTWQRCPTPSPVWVLSCILLLFLWGFFKWRRSWTPCICILILLGCLACGAVPDIRPLIRQNRKNERRLDAASFLSFTFLDVGEGDSAVIRFPNGQQWVLDAGGHWLSPVQGDTAYAFDIGESVVSRYLWHGWTTKLDRLILTHSDLDHAGGMFSVIKNFEITRFDHSQADHGAILDRILDISRRKHMAVFPLHAGMEEKVGAVTVHALNPPVRSRFRSSNENSVVLQFRLKRFSALLTGDLEKSVDPEFLSQPELRHSQLLKVAHHGSRSGTSDPFLDRVQPRWAVVSAGRNNPFRHHPDR